MALTLRMRGAPWMLALISSAFLFSECIVAAEANESMMDSRVFQRSGCGLMQAPPLKEQNAPGDVTALPNELANIALNAVIKFSAGLIKNIGKEESKASYASAPLYFLKSVTGQAATINPDWRCLILVRGRFGAARDASLDRWLQEREQAWISRYDPISLKKRSNCEKNETIDNCAGVSQLNDYIRSFNLSSEPEVFAEIEVVPSSGNSIFKFLMRHLKISRNKVSSLFTGERQFVLALQLSESAGTSASPKISERSSMSAIDAALASKTGIALGTFAFSDVYAPVELDDTALEGKESGWMSVNKTNFDLVAMKVDAGEERSALKAQCQIVYGLLASANGVRPKNANIENILKLCRDVSKDLEAAFVALQPILSEENRKMMQGENADLWLLRGYLDAKIVGANKEKTLIELPKPPEEPLLGKILAANSSVQELQRQRDLVDAVIATRSRFEALEKASVKNPPPARYGYPVDLTVAFVETRSAIGWLSALGTSIGADIEQKSGSWATAIADEIAPSPGKESQATTNRVAAQRSALESYATLITQIATYQSETDPVQRRAKYVTAFGGLITYKDKVRLFEEAGGNRSELPTIPELPPAP